MFDVLNKTTGSSTLKSMRRNLRKTSSVKNTTRRVTSGNQTKTQVTEIDVSDQDEDDNKKKKKEDEIDIYEYEGSVSSDSNSTDYGENHVEQLIAEKEAMMKSAVKKATSTVNNKMKEMFKNIGMGSGDVADFSTAQQAAANEKFTNMDSFKTDQSIQVYT